MTADGLSAVQHVHNMYTTPAAVCSHCQPRVFSFVTAVASSTFRNEVQPGVTRLRRFAQYHAVNAQRTFDAVVFRVEAECAESDGTQ